MLTLSMMTADLCVDVVEDHENRKKYIAFHKINSNNLLLSTIPFMM